MLGLSNGNTDTSYEDIDFGIDLDARRGGLYVYEKGVNRGSFGPTTTVTSSASPSSAAS